MHQNQSAKLLVNNVNNFLMKSFFLQIIMLN